MGHDQTGGEGGADPGPGEGPDPAVTETARVRLDDPADRVQRPARRHRADAAVHRLPGALDEQAGFFAPVTGEECPVGVAGPAPHEGGEVPVGDVAAPRAPGVGYARADDLIS